ncbi:hypothetical protein K470DRAFT_255789 [Piedraia hortae CBS 480.64]|uniref:Uncharacterized protein n=1 Tax=Piedraia hortae CBS 480.64 TaxID=1314780 RepID=A0A6A7C750_9PEZI|nr:hypothetical protein K470DRAFT_255789 [Piedraia hortae CBS 480.64]
MEDLMVISQEKEVTPGLALETWNAQMEAQGAPQAGQQQQQQQQQAQTAVGFAPNGVPMMARTPSMQSMAMSAQAGAFPSPHVAQMQLPNGINGSPHFGYAPAMAASYTFPPGAHAMSPRQGAMAAPLMMAQRSQQGTNSSAASGTTSPTVNNKRRRSAAKGMEDDGGEVHGMQRMKPSPRIAKKSKPGG